MHFFYQTLFFVKGSCAVFAELWISHLEQRFLGTQTWDQAIPPKRGRSKNSSWSWSSAEQAHK